MRIHSEEKKYDQHYKSFIIQTKMHIAEKLFYCGHCDNYFSAKSDLIIHMRKHTEEKPLPLKCMLCNFSAIS